MITLKIFQKQHFYIISVTPWGTLGLCCVHISQLIAHLAIYTLPFTLQLQASWHTVESNYESEGPYIK